MPTASVSAAGATTFCQGGSVTLNAQTGTGYSYQWKKNGGNITGATNASYAASAPGSYSCEVTATGGCSKVSNAISVTVNPLPTASVSAAGATTFCQGGSVTLNAQTGTGYSYQWKKNGANIAGATNASYAASAPGSYSCEVSTSAGCSKVSNSVSVTVNPTVTATLGVQGDSALCQGESLTLTAASGSGYGYQWQKNTVDLSGAFLSTLSVNAPGSYRYILTNTNGCPDTSRTIVVSVNPLPNSDFTVSGNVLTATPVGADAYQWYMGGSVVAGAISETYTITQTGDYAVEVTQSGCSKTSSTKTVTLTSVAARLASGYECNIYPNPSSGLFTLEMTKSNEAVTVRVFDMLGKEVWFKAVGENQDAFTGQIDLSGQPKGVYLLRLEGERNMEVRKLVIE